MMACIHVVALTLCLLALDFSAGQPMITTPPVETDAPPGANVTFTCGVSDLTNRQFVAWYTGAGSPISNNETVVLTGGRPGGQSYELDVVHTAGSEVLFILTLRNIQLSESGTYSCRIYEERGDGTPMQLAIRAIRLSVEFFPSDENPMCMTAGNFTASEGDYIDLVCESDLGAPTIDITWKRGNDPLAGLVPDVNGASVSLSYTFEAKRTDQDTLFKCRITNLVDFPGKEGLCISGPLNVLYPPEDFIITEAPERAPGGLFTAFQCNAGGNPPPTFSWSFNTPLSISSYSIADNRQLFIQLEVLQCNTTDIIATCEASNSQGTFTTNTTLCKVPTCSPNNTAFNALEGESLTITCTVDESVDELIWDQYDFNSSSNITLDSTMDMSSLQYQWHVERAQAYSLYTCNAINKSPNTTVPLFIGTCTSGPLLKVFFPPENVTIMAATQTDKPDTTSTGFGSSTKETSGVIIISTSVVGVVLIAVVLTAIICYCRKRYKTAGDDSHYYSTNLPRQDSAPVLQDNSEIANPKADSRHTDNEGYDTPRDNAAYQDLELSTMTSSEQEYQGLYESVLKDNSKISNPNADSRDADHEGYETPPDNAAYQDLELSTITSSEQEYQGLYERAT